MFHQGNKNILIPLGLTNLDLGLDLWVEFGETVDLWFNNLISKGIFGFQKENIFLDFYYYYIFK